MEDGKDPLLHPGLEVDEHVSAADQVHAAERRVPGHVVPGEDAHVADGLDHPVSAVHLGEKPLQACWRDVLGDVREVLSRPRLLHGALGEVRAEDLEGGGRPLSRGFQQADDERVDLLAGGAPGHPHPHRRAGRPILQQPRQDLAGQDLEGARVAEEGGDRDEALLMEGLRLVRVVLEVARVLLQRLDVGEHHAPCDPPLDGRRLVRAEVRAGRPAQQGQDRAEPIRLLRRRGRRVVRSLVAGRRDHVGMAAEPGELLCDACRRQDEVHAPRRDGAARHAVVRGRLQVLGEDDAAFRLDRPRSERPVRAGPGQDHADRLAAPGLGQRAQEGVDRQVSAPRGDTRDQLQQVAFDGDVVPPRGDVDVVGLDHRVPPDLGDRHAASLCQQVGQDALVAGVQVLHEHEGHAGVDRQRSQELSERVQSARGGPHADDGESAPGLGRSFRWRSGRRLGGSSRLRARPRRATARRLIAARAQDAAPSKPGPRIPESVSIAQPGGLALQGAAGRSGRASRGRTGRRWPRSAP